jgi:hypothetical protein
VLNYAGSVNDCTGRTVDERSEVGTVVLAFVARIEKMLGALSLSRRLFSASPYNPMRYLNAYVDTKMPTKQEIHDFVHTLHESGG